MSTISLSTYAIRVQPRLGTHNLRVDSFGDGFDLLTFFQDYLHSRHNHPIIYRESQQAISSGNQFHRGRSLSGIIFKGAYGEEIELYNVTQLRQSGTQGVDDAGMRPFYFLAVIPINHEFGLIALQSTGVYGVKTVFTEDLDNFVRDITGDEFKLVFEPHITEEVFEQYLARGSVTKIRLIKFGPPSSDIADFVHLGLDEEEIITELQIQARRNRSFDIMEPLRQILRRGRDVREFFPSTDLDYDNVKVEVHLAGGNYKVFDLGDPDQIRPKFDITDSVELGLDGHPEFSSIDEASREIMADILESMRLDNSDVR